MLLVEYSPSTHVPYALLPFAFLRREKIDINTGIFSILHAAFGVNEKAPETER